MNIVIKHVNAIFFWNASDQEKKKKKKVSRWRLRVDRFSEIMKPVSGKGSLDDANTHIPVYDPVLKDRGLQNPLTTTAT